MVKLEDRPYTLNTHYLGDYKHKFLNHYKTQRQQTAHSSVATALARYVPPVSQFMRGGRRRTIGIYSKPTNEDVSAILAGCTRIGISGVKAADLGALLPHDEMEHALEIMADVRAYFQGRGSVSQCSPSEFVSVAYKRYIDNVPLAIDYDLVQGLDRGLLVTLYERLGIHGAKGQEICKELAQESPQMADRREELTKKLERLQTAYQELMQSS